MLADSRLNIYRSLKGLPRAVWVLSAATLVNRAGTMVLPFLVLYLTRELGFSAERAGLVLGVYGAGAIIAAPVAGRLCDRIGALPIMQVSLLASGIILLMFPFAETFTAVLLLTLAWSLVSESYRPANLTLVAAVVPPEQRKPAFALTRLAINLGMSIGPAVAGFLAVHSFRSIFIVDATTTITAGLMLIFVRLGHFRSGSAKEDRQHAGPARAERHAVFEDARLLLFLSGIFLTGAVFFQHEGALPLFLVQSLALSPAFYGMLFTINTLMIVFMEVPLNSATASWSHRKGLAAGALLFAVGSATFGFAKGPAVIIIGIVIWTFGEMMLFPQAAAYVADIAPEHRRGEYMGAYSLAFSLAFAVAPWAGTAAYARFGGELLWAGVFLVGAIAALMLWQVPEEKTTAAAMSV